MADRHDLPEERLALDYGGLHFDVVLVWQALSERKEVGLLTGRVELLTAVELDGSDEVDGAAEFEWASNDGLDAAVSGQRKVVLASLKATASSIIACSA